MKDCALGLSFGHRVVYWVVLLMSSLVFAEHAPDVIEDQAGTVRVVFANGFELVVVPMSDADVFEGGRDGQAWLVVRGGSLYETDAQRGSAMVVKQVIEMGTASFSADEISDLMVFEPMVRFDQAIFPAGFDVEDSDAFEEALSFFGDVLGGEIDFGHAFEQPEGAISQVIEENRNESEVEFRSRRAWLPELFEGTLFGSRMPMAKIEELEALSKASVEAFADQRYRPEHATLIVVGDVDVDAMVEQVRRTLGAGDVVDDRASIVDGRLKVDLAMRAVLGHDPGFEKQQAAMVWVQDREQRIEAWSEQAKRYSDADMREMIVGRVVGEIVRHRLKRLSVQSFGIESEMSVDVVDLWGQVDLMQVGIESSETWEELMGFIVAQTDRLARDGVVVGEVERARRSVLSKWHRDADDWVEMSTQQRMGLVHWLVVAGRPIIDMVRWDEMATRLMGTISDDEIDSALRTMVQPDVCGYIGLTGSDELGDGFHESVVLGVVEHAMGQQLGAIEPGWMEQLGDSLLDVECKGGDVDEVSVHPDSEVWDTRLDNGVRVLARSVERGQGQVVLSATIWGQAGDVGVVGADGVSAAVLAWQMPTAETRNRQAISLFMEAYGLSVYSRHDVGYVQLVVSGSVDEIDRAMELMYVLLDRPMIDGEAFDAWQQAWKERERDPVDAGIHRLYNSQGFERGELITLDEAQRVLTQIVRNGQIDIGIAGDVDTEAAIEVAREYFGSLVKRDRDHRMGHTQALAAAIPGASRHARVVSSNVDELGFVYGYVGKVDQDLGEVRALLLASMILDQQLGVSLGDGNDGIKLKSQIAFSDDLMGRVVFIVRARCGSKEIGDAQELVEVGIEQLLDDGIDASELATMQQGLAGSIDRYFGTANFWSQRLSVLGMKGLRVEDLWGIREGYLEIEANEVVRVLNALVADNERFVIEIIEE